MKNFKENMKRFWSLQKKSNSGFTLVELIVVIAILAILAGIAVPAYSGYVEKANKQADMTLVSEVEQALALEYYSNSNGLQGVVVLSLNDAPNCGDSENLEAALVKAFGENWAEREDLRLKYDGWSATFQESNFYNDEAGLTELLGTVDTLTGALGNFLDKHSDKLNDGGAFASYVNTIAGEDGTVAAKADAAVFYIADEIGRLDSNALQNAVTALQNPANQSNADNALAALNNELGGSSLTSMAALYALAEGYATYFETNEYTPTTAGAQTPRDILNEFNEKISETAGADDATTAKVFGELFNSFNQMGAANGNALQEYLKSPVAQDLSAFGEAMKTVSASKDGIISNDSNLGSENYFSSDYISNLLSAYSEGGIFVYVLEDNGQIKVTSTIDVDEQ